jgi:hypothetical protein
MEQRQKIMSQYATTDAKKKSQPEKSNNWQKMFKKTLENDKSGLTKLPRHSVIGGVENIACHIPKKGS